MTKIGETALSVAGDFMKGAVGKQNIIDFAHALLAELSKDAVPVGYVAHGSTVTPSERVFVDCSIISKDEADEYIPECITAIFTHPANTEAFQSRVWPWLLACFGEEISNDKAERNHRFLEESLELVQATGCTASEAHQLVEYVYGRPVGEPYQEVGGVMVTLAALCLANNLDMHDNGETELARIWTKVEKIRSKQAAKPKHSPLPESSPTETIEQRVAEACASFLDFWDATSATVLAKELRKGKWREYL